MTAMVGPQMKMKKVAMMHLTHIILLMILFKTHRVEYAIYVANSYLGSLCCLLDREDIREINGES